MLKKEKSRQRLHAISMALCKTIVTPSQMSVSYNRFAPSHRFIKMFENNVENGALAHDEQMLHFPL